MNITPVFHPMTQQAKPFGAGYCALLPGKVFGMDWKTDRSCAFNDQVLYDIGRELVPVEAVMIAEEHKGPWLAQEASKTEIQMVARNYSKAVAMLKQAGVKRVYDYGSGNYSTEELKKLKPYLCSLDGITPGAKLKGPLTQSRDMKRAVNRIAEIRDANLDIEIVPAVYHRREPDGIGGGTLTDETWGFELIDRAAWVEHLENLGVETALLQCQYDFSRMMNFYPNYPRKGDPKAVVKFLAREVRRYIKWGRAA